MMTGGLWGAALWARLKKTAESAANFARRDDPQTEAIRRLYLNEFVQRWDAFLGDIRIVGGTSLEFDLQVLRRLAAPDSPITRLAAAVVHETTLTRPVVAEDSSILQKASEKLADKADKVLGTRPHERLERDLVDSHFAALREIVTGQAGSRPGEQVAPGGRPASGMDGITTLLNDYYTALLVAQSAIAGKGLPPASDAASKVKMMANTMPAPLRNVLLGLSSQGSRDVESGCRSVALPPVASGHRRFVSPGPGGQLSVQPRPACPPHPDDGSIELESGEARSPGHARLGARQRWKCRFAGVPGARPRGNAGWRHLEKFGAVLSMHDWVTVRGQAQQALDRVSGAAEHGAPDTRYLMPIEGLRTAEAPARTAETGYRIWPHSACAGSRKQKPGRQDGLSM